jgi:hypothetical protein
VCLLVSVCVQSYVKTMAASLTAASWRIFLMPLDVRLDILFLIIIVYIYIYIIHYT